MNMQGEFRRGLRPMDLNAFVAVSYQWRGLRFSP